MTVALVAIGVLVMNLGLLLRRRGGPAITIGAPWTYAESVAAPTGNPPPDSGALLSALRLVLDPELDLSVVDMGLLDSLQVDSAGRVRVVLLLTTPECPYYASIARQALQRLAAVPGTRKVTVRLEPDSEWEPSRLTAEGKRRFRELFGDGAGAGR